MKNVRDSSRNRMQKEERRPRAAAISMAIALAIGAAVPLAAEPSLTPPEQSGNAPRMAPAADAMPSFADHDPELAPSAASGQRYVAEIVDSLFVVGPAEFFALDLPPNPPGALAVHLLGTVSVADKKGDIMIRLFRAPDYQNWLKKRGGEKAEAVWVSKRSKNITLDQDLGEAGPYVVLLDNGYSMRTTKHVRTQLQIQYQWTGAGVSAAAHDSTAAGAAEEDDIIKPRANAEENIPAPPPPPPPDEGTH